PDKSTEFGFRRDLRDGRDDSPFVARFTYRPLAGFTDDERHTAAMLLAAILDSRKLPRLPDGGHPLPALPDGEAVFQGDEILVGFRDGRERRLHPLFSARLASR